MGGIVLLFIIPQVEHISYSSEEADTVTALAIDR